MLKEYFKKVFSTQVDNGAQATQQKEDVTMTTNVEPNGDMTFTGTLTAAEGTLGANTTAALTAQLEAVTATLAEKEQQLAELTAQFAEAKATLEAAETAKADLAAQAAAEELQRRTAAVVKAVGTDKAEAVLAATTGLPKEQFNVIVSAMATSVDAEANTKMFTETGAAAEAKAPVENAPTHFKQFIKN
jgi:hypothetical protein